MIDVGVPDRYHLGVLSRPALMPSETAFYFATPDTVGQIEQRVSN